MSDVHVYYVDFAWRYSDNSQLRAFPDPQPVDRERAKLRAAEILEGRDR